MYFADNNGNMCTKRGSSQLESSHCIVNNNTPGGNTGIETAQWALVDTTFKSEAPGMAYAVRHHIVSVTTCHAAGSSCGAAS